MEGIVKVLKLLIYLNAERKDLIGPMTLYCLRSNLFALNRVMSRSKQCIIHIAY